MTVGKPSPTTVMEPIKGANSTKAASLTMSQNARTAYGNSFTNAKTEPNVPMRP